jgi:hypothetical protein
VAHHHVSFPLQAPGALAGDVLEELERELGIDVALGSDAIVTVGVDADSREEAVLQVVEAIHHIHGDGYFDLHELRKPMAVSIRRYEVGAGSLEELTSVVAQGFARMLLEAEGFVAWHLMRSGAREVTSIKIFSDRESWQGSERLTADWEREHLARFRMRRLDEETGDVLVSRRAR